MPRISLADARQRAVAEAKERYSHKHGLRIRERGTCLVRIVGVTCYRCRLSAEFRETSAVFSMQEGTAGAVMDVEARVTNASLQVIIDICVATGQILGIQEVAGLQDDGAGRGTSSASSAVVGVQPFPCPHCGQQAIAKVWSGGKVEKECLSCGRIW